MDFNGLADPYVKLHLLPGACKVYFHDQNMVLCLPAIKNRRPVSTYLLLSEGATKAQFRVKAGFPVEDS